MYLNECWSHERIYLYIKSWSDKERMIYDVLEALNTPFNCCVHVYTHKGRISRGIHTSTLDILHAYSTYHFSLYIQHARLMLNPL